MKWRIRSQIINGHRFWISTHPLCDGGKERHTLTWREAVDHMVEDELHAFGRSCAFPVCFIAGWPT